VACTAPHRHSALRQHQNPLAATSHDRVCSILFFSGHSLFSLLCVLSLLCLSFLSCQLSRLTTRWPTPFCATWLLLVSSNVVSDLLLVSLLLSFSCYYYCLGRVSSLQGRPDNPNTGSCTPFGPRIPYVAPLLPCRSDSQQVHSSELGVTATSFDVCTARLGAVVCVLAHSLAYFDTLSLS
jgi:hypothetical protein